MVPIFALMVQNRILWPAFFLVIYTSVLNGQGQSELQYTVAYHRAFLIAHRPLVVPLQQDKINGFELCVSKSTDGSRDWHHVYRFPDTGISFAMWDLGNPGQLGRSITILPYLDFPLAGNSRSELKLKFGWGIGIIEKRFDSDENYKNVAVGSRMNNSLILQPHYNLRVSSQLTAHGGISLTHYSNGSIVVPNLGLNIAGITAGIKWTPYRFDRPELKKPPVSKSTRTSFFLSGSSKQVYPAQGKNFFAATISGNRAYQISPKSAFGFGADLFYDHSIYRKLEQKEKSLNNDFETLRGGIHGSYELGFGRVSISLNVGGYLYSKMNDGLFYHRFGLRYQFHEKLFACMNIKSHWGKADFMEWGIGYKVRRGGS
jgi:hypothetical protein